MKTEDDSPDKSRSHGDFDMFPDTFVDGGKDSHKSVVVAEFIKKMEKGAGKNNTDNTKIHHGYILTQKSKLFLLASLNGRADRNRTCIADLEGLGPIR